MLQIIYLIDLFRLYFVIKHLTFLKLRKYTSIPCVIIVSVTTLLVREQVQSSKALMEFVYMKLNR